MGDKIKQFFYVVILMGSANAAYAEGPINTGTYSLSGSLSFSSSKQESTSQSTEIIKVRRTEFHPGFMYFVQPDLALGALFSYAKTSGDATGVDEIGLGPVVRYYFHDETIHSFVEGEYIFSKTKFAGSSISGYEYDTRTTSFGFGMDIFLARNVAVEPMLLYSNTSFRYSDDVSSFDLDLSNLSFRIGINVFIY